MNTMNKEEQIKEWFEKNFVYNCENRDTIRFLYNFINDDDKLYQLKYDYYELLDLINRIKNNKKVAKSLCLLVYRIACNLEVYFGEGNFFYALEEILIKKNRDYGSSFDKSINKFGWIYVAIELDKKKNRLHSLLKNKEKPNYESVEDTLLDIAGYCVLSLIYLENKEA